jgi:mono/diheme cytochrome c family protein
MIGAARRRSCMHPGPGAAALRLIAAASLAIMAGTALAQPSDDPARGSPSLGEAMAQRWCNQCHAVGRTGTGTDAAPPFAAIARDPARGTTRHLRAFLAQPHPPMPPIPLSGSEVEDLIAYIQSSRR